MGLRRARRGDVGHPNRVCTTYTLSVLEDFLDLFVFPCEDTERRDLFKRKRRDQFTNRIKEED